MYACLKNVHIRRRGFANPHRKGGWGHPYSGKPRRGVAMAKIEKPQ